MSILRLTEEQYAAKQKIAARAADRRQEVEARLTPRVVGEANGAEQPNPHLKYRNRPTGGYSSRREYGRAQELKLLAAAGEITELEEQVTYVLIPPQKGERAVKYICDFRYVDKAGYLVVEDAKGVSTPDYVIKRKLMLWVHGIRVSEV